MLSFIYRTISKLLIWATTIGVKSLMGNRMGASHGIKLWYFGVQSFSFGLVQNKFWTPIRAFFAHAAQEV
ncbi:hypothetical protein PN36_29965 [Candidatus Thiomargarita nelsonii]|uniref:Uncharacterized protein n=1 Tax=Candidatus Thiomargarita nelsonii TaxID=1003181 RepID=A0A0A6P419_9GAMM|nr:hypothetical protein PN36_29965 [Candidatus Thiomargarita nelsonii]